ncbi:hypothetical protein GCM10010260_65530 [Streptomyces filipinensis]|uniref:Uncharacterized protein n=1 Tax=Streptomyces filipinensis TaxID=66887 RepID=A0A918IH38_9ACTN|nr:hypothetical protein GCM10010260_65530 [Streptomyces filipinensis]
MVALGPRRPGRRGPARPGSLTTILRRRRLTEVLIDTGDGAYALLRAGALEPALAQDAVRQRGVTHAEVRLRGRGTAPVAGVRLQPEPGTDPAAALTEFTTRALTHATPVGGPGVACGGGTAEGRQAPRGEGRLTAGGEPARQAGGAVSIGGSAAWARAARPRPALRTRAAYPRPRAT